MMMSNDRKQIEAWLANCWSKVELELIADQSPPATRLRQFCNMLADISQKVKIKKRSPDADTEQPAILVSRRLKYQAVPQGPELSPFLNALTRHINPPSGAGAAENVLNALRIPAHLQVYIAPQCPHCPHTVEQLLALLQANDNLSITIIDGTLFTDVAEKDLIKSVPTVILDTDFRWTGSVDMAELMEAISNRDPIKLGPQALRSFIDDGRASDLAQMMIKAQAVFPALCDLITHDLWSIRLGAMVVTEEIAWNDRPLAGTMISRLQNQFAKTNETVQGDILYVIGQCGNADHIRFLESIAAKATSEELCEAAQDAIACIQTYWEHPEMQR